jgi:succinate dehydrogenase/fumarate reductase-like Fe-S protein
MSGPIKITIGRKDPFGGGTVHDQDYEIQTGRAMTVLEALQEIYCWQDPTLAFRHYRCGRRLCRSCEVKVNGKVVRGCATLLHPGRAYRIDVARPEAIIRDLVFDFEAQKSKAARE